MNVNELKIEMLRHGDNGADLAKALGIVRQTLSTKMNGSNGSEFTQGEIAKIKDRYNLSPERIAEIFFAQKMS